MRRRRWPQRPRHSRAPARKTTAARAALGPVSPASGRAALAASIPPATRATRAARRQHARLRPQEADRLRSRHPCGRGSRPSGCRRPSLRAGSAPTLRSNLVASWRMLQLLAQLPSRTMQVHVDLVRVEPEHSRARRAVHSVHVEHHEQAALRLRQNVDELAQLAGELVLLVVPRGIAAVADLGQLFGVLDDHTTGPAKAAQARIARDAEQPLAWTLDLLAMLPVAQESLLRHVLGLARIAQQRRREAKDGAVVHEHREPKSPT